VSYDEKCYELAKYFLPDERNESRIMALAQEIQDCVEFEIGDEE
jgi:hypothetical protein